MCIIPLDAPLRPYVYGKLNLQAYICRERYNLTSRYRSVERDKTSSVERDKTSSVERDKTSSVERDKTSSVDIDL